jgi:hypothetical protein
MSFSVEGFEPGVLYRLSFFTAARTVHADSSAAQLSVYVKSSLVYRSPEVGETTSFQRREVTFVAAEEKAVIAFRNTGLSGYDQTLFVDNLKFART